MTDTDLWTELLDIEHTVLVRLYDERWPRKDRAPETVIVIAVEPDEDSRNRCPRCGEVGKPVESEVQRWVTLDMHGKRTFLESPLPKIICTVHGTITAMVPWARHPAHQSDQDQSSI